VPTRVVIAEDEAIIRLDLKETLQEEGYEVVGETGRGDEAIVLVRDLSPALAYLVKPFQRSELIPAVEVALGRFREMQALFDQNTTLEEQLETRKVVDRAKGLLMDGHGLSESDAFSWIQKRAMQDRRTMRAVADEVIAGNLAPEG
jgi:AmiR/NasT family two-component response regulator